MSQVLDSGHNSLDRFHDNTVYSNQLDEYVSKRKPTDQRDRQNTESIAETK